MPKLAVLAGFLSDLFVSAAPFLVPGSIVVGLVGAGVATKWKVGLRAGLAASASSLVCGFVGAFAGIAVGGLLLAVLALFGLASALAGAGGHTGSPPPFYAGWERVVLLTPAILLAAVAAVGGSIAACSRLNRASPHGVEPRPRT